MRHLKIGTTILLLTFSLTFAGCNLFPQRNTRPAPIRPNPTVSPSATNAPTKNIPGTTSLTEKDLTKRINTVETAVKEGNWTKANKDGDKLGLDMTRYRPNAPNGKSLRDMSRFDVIYTKLQGDLKTKNKTGCMKDLTNLRNAMKDLKK
jgi:hypothetical protein